MHFNEADLTKSDEQEEKYHDCDDFAYNVFMALAEEDTAEGEGVDESDRTSNEDGGLPTCEKTAAKDSGNFLR